MFEIPPEVPSGPRKLFLNASSPSSPSSTYPRRPPGSSSSSSSSSLRSPFLGADSARLGLVFEISSASFMAASSLFFVAAFFERRVAGVIGKEGGFDSNKLLMVHGMWFFHEIIP